MHSYVLMLQTDADDRDLTEAILGEISLTIPVQFLDNIDELDTLTTTEGPPALILISDSSKDYTAIELLKKLKTHVHYRHIPLVILGENTLPDYIKDCYAAGASSFIIKPSSIDLTKKKIEAFFTYWFKVAELPNVSPVAPTQW